MLRHRRMGTAAAVIMLFAGCAEYATPVAVLAPKPEHEGTEPPQVGVACTVNVLWVFAYGDSHISKAKANGSISDIATVEITREVIFADFFPLNLYRRQCTEVAGYS